MSKTRGLYTDELEKAQALNVKLLEALKEVLNCFQSSPPALTLSALKNADLIITEAEKEML